MSNSIWRLMVEVQVSRRDRQPASQEPPRPQHPPTLRSVRELLIDDHYAILAAGDY